MFNSQLAWSEYLQQDAELLKTCRLDASSTCRVYFHCTIEMTCRLYKFFEAYLGDQIYYTDSTCLNPKTRIFTLYHGESTRSVREAALKSSDSSGVVRRVFATQSLKACPHWVPNVHWTGSNPVWAHPHWMRICPIQIRSGLIPIHFQRWFWSGLN